MLFSNRQQKILDTVHRTKEHNIYTFQCALDSKSGPYVSVDNKNYKMLSSYDYLGLIGNVEIERQAQKAIDDFGTGSGGVRLLTGTNKLHLELEKEIANFKGTESAVTYSSGYQANLAIISGLFDPKDIILADSKIHQSTIDACKLAGVTYKRFEHNSSKSLEKLIQNCSGSRRICIITEGIFSMDGDISNLPSIVEIKNKYGAILMIDESHSLGVLGPNGCGVDSFYGIASEEVDIFTGSLSKAIPANGGFIAGKKDLITYLQHGSSPYMFSAAMGPGSAASVLASIDIMKNEPNRFEKLWSNTNFLKSELQKLEYNLGLSSSPIIPVIMGSDNNAMHFSKKLFDRSIIATPVVFPAVPKNQARLRLCVTAAQSPEFLEEVVEVFKDLKDKK